MMRERGPVDDIGPSSSIGDIDRLDAVRTVDEVWDCDGRRLDAAGVVGGAGRCRRAQSSALQ
ncbi:hypothetical protein ABH922_004422 [Rhodococcus sp. 27YEA15]|uniref:hypothetical protein n=1 Tax=Rhodococcus sp. 27YEA15 TaxID=3156259 RepID=UPI003C7B3DDF